MSRFLNECDRLGDRIHECATEWHVPVRVPNARAAVAVGASWAVALIALVLA